MTVPTHDRTLDHTGTEDTETATIAQDIGRYPAGMSLQDVLEDFVERLTFMENNQDTAIFSFTANAVVFMARVFTADASITFPIYTFTADSDIKATVPQSFTAKAITIDHVQGSAALVGSIGPSDSPITVTTTATFPFSTPFTITVDSEQMTVTGGGGTTTWTVTRGANGTTAASHTSGTLVIEVC